MEQNTHLPKSGEDLLRFLNDYIESYANKDESWEIFDLNIFLEEFYYHLSVQLNARSTTISITELISALNKSKRIHYE